jgi:hypothetical protein
MMKKPRRKIDAALKAKIALEALREQSSTRRVMLADLQLKYYLLNLFSKYSMPYFLLFACVKGLFYSNVHRF